LAIGRRFASWKEKRTNPDLNFPRQGEKIVSKGKVGGYDGRCYEQAKRERLLKEGAIANEGRETRISTCSREKKENKSTEPG